MSNPCVREDLEVEKQAVCMTCDAHGEHLLIWRWYKRSWQQLDYKHKVIESLSEWYESLKTRFHLLNIYHETWFAWTPKIITKLPWCNFWNLHDWRRKWNTFSVTWRRESMESRVVLSIECVSTSLQSYKTDSKQVSIGLSILFLLHPPPPSFLLLDLCVCHLFVHAAKFSFPYNDTWFPVGTLRKDWEKDLHLSDLSALVSYSFCCNKSHPRGERRM